MLKIGDKVLILKSSVCDSEPMELKYIGERGVVVGIHLDRPASISVKINGVGTDGFHEEELEKV